MVVSLDSPRPRVLTGRGSCSSRLSAPGHAQCNNSGRRRANDAGVNDEAACLLYGRASSAFSPWRVLL